MRRRRGVSKRNGRDGTVVVECIIVHVLTSSSFVALVLPNSPFNVSLYAIAAREVHITKVLTRVRSTAPSVVKWAAREAKAKTATPGKSTNIAFFPDTNEDGDEEEEEEEIPPRRAPFLDPLLLVGSGASPSLLLIALSRLLLRGDTPAGADDVTAPPAMVR